jgi:serine/threonine-protein kinase
VLSQAPKSGALLHAGGKVNLVVAQASQEVAVPDVVGQGEAQAAAALGEAGLKPKASSSTTSEAAQVGIVLKQTPAAGTKVHKGSKVSIAVGVLGGSTTTTPTTPVTTTPTTPAATPPP